jgi:hypothetical protein
MSKNEEKARVHGISVIIFITIMMYRQLLKHIRGSQTEELYGVFVGFDTTRSGRYVGV